MTVAVPQEMEARARAWADVVLASRLLAVDPYGLGGIHLRGRPGAVRDWVCAWILGLLPSVAPRARIPLHITDDRLLGGVSLADTLHTGKIVWEHGLLARCHGGIAVLPMAERVESRVASQLCALLDRGELAIERESRSAVVPCRIGLLALDEGIDDEHAPSSLCDRLAFAVDLDVLDGRAIPVVAPEHDALARARACLPGVTLAADDAEALCRAATTLGIASLRAIVLAGRVARVHAALEGRMRVEAPDLEAGARLVLGPRATRLGAPPESAAEQAPTASDDASGHEAPPGESDDAPQTRGADGPDARDRDDDAPRGPSPEEIVLAAAKSAMPEGLLSELGVGTTPRTVSRGTGRSGASRVSFEGGRPAGTMSSPRHAGARLAVLDTLRAAAPWQRLRRGTMRDGERARRVEVRKQDFRVRRFHERSETCVIFAVDASGSAALQRLAEAKGAVERVLVDCYVRRDHVALIAFRGTEASLVLPPTRSLARVRRRLAALAGGGTTPLAAGIDAALGLANASRKCGRAPVVVMMTDGRGNVARDGRTGTESARADALECSRRLRVTGVPTLLLDTSPRSQPRVRALAAEMNARYVALPRLGAAGVSQEIRALVQESTPCR